MSIYRRDEVLPEWEPNPWTMRSDAADEQELGFHQRATKVIRWTAIPWKSFPEEGVFGHPKAWLISIDAAFFATSGHEDQLLIDNTWFGFPDPPRWGLISRPHGQHDAQWLHWGHFPDLPQAWIVPTTCG